MVWASHYAVEIKLCQLSLVLSSNVRIEYNRVVLETLLGY